MVAAFQINPYAGGTNSCFKNQLPTLVVQTVLSQINSLHWRYKQLFYKLTPTLVVQIVGF